MTARSPVTNDLSMLEERRLAGWRQTPKTCIPGPEAAIPLIDRVGIATLFPASPEIPNLFHAYVGDPAAATASEWDSPSGQVYGWRWTLGRMGAAFYTAIVRDRPTWVSWSVLPAILRLRGEMRSPEQLYHAGLLSDGAYRISRALEEAGGVLSTGELRAAAGFPTGKAERAAYLKAVAELDTRLMLAKVFSPGDEDMRHALVDSTYPDHVEEAESLDMDDALDRLLLAYLPAAAFAAPIVLARHLRIPEPALRAALERMVETHGLLPVELPGYKGMCYVWPA